MVPEEQPKPTPTQSQSDNPTGSSPRRRSRRGGRRHTRRREPRSSEESLPPSTSPSEPDRGSEEHTGPAPAAHQIIDTPVEGGNETVLPEQRVPPLRAAATERSHEQPRLHRDSLPQREHEVENKTQNQRLSSEPRAEVPRATKTRSITQAIEQVNQIITELKRALEEMDDVLETLELAERQKVEDERELDNLQRSLRRLNRPRDDEHRRY